MPSDEKKADEVINIAGALKHDIMKVSFTLSREYPKRLVLFKGKFQGT